MSSIRHSLGLSALLLVAAGVASPAAAQDTEFTAYLSRTVKPNSGERLGFHLWGASSVDVEEYRLRASELESALRQNGLQIDTSSLTPRRVLSFTGWQGDIQIADGAGVYVYVARSQGGTGVRTQAQAVVVSRLSLGVKRDDDSSLVMINEGDRPASNATLKVYEADDQNGSATILRNERVRRGVGYFWTRSTKSLIYVARRGRHVAIQNSWDRTWSANANAFHVHVETDRPLYRPGQTFHFKAILRENQQGAHRTPVGEEVRVFLRDAQGSRVSVATENTNDFGSVNGSYTISEAAGLGDYTLEVEAGQAQAGGSSVVGSARFGVEEYRKPEYKVEVTTAESSYVQGDTITATVQADYFFGAPVPGAQVEYTVRKRNRWRWWNPWIRPMVFDAISPSIWWPGFGSNQVIDQGTATTAGDGSATFTFTANREDWDSDYEITAKVVDASNREVSGSSTVAVTRAAFDLILVTDRYVYEPGDLVRLQVNTAANDGTPTSAPVEITIDRFLPDGTEERRFQRTRTTNSDGTYSIVLRASGANHYRITAKAQDADGNEVTATRNIWVADDQGTRNWNYSSVTITPDKDTYEPGDNATILIQAPALSGRGLITLESENIKSVYLFDIVGGLGLITLPIEATMTPNIFVTVMVPTDTGFQSASKELQVPPTDKMISVEVVADKAEYLPGEDATFKLRAVDADGNPVRAEISLGVVDEALFALREDETPKLTETFFPHQWNRVNTLGASGGGFHRGGPGGPIFLATTLQATARNTSSGNSGVREYFPDTLHWIADVETDFRGEATITKTMADSLTTWRLTARAITRDDEVGQTKTTTLVRKDLVVRLAAPRALVEGDRMELVGIVHNLAKEGTPGAEPASVSLQLDAQGVTIVGSPSRTLSVERGGQESVTWTVDVTGNKSAEFTLRGQAAFEQDALRINVPIAPRGVAAPVSESGSMRQNGVVTLTLDKDPDAIESATELNISLSPSLAGTMLDSVDYLVGYPYGCIEQTMSKFLPTLMVAETLRTIGRDDPALRDELPKMVKKGVEKLQGLQNADGGWGWFGGRGGASTSHPFVSAYAFYGLALAKQEGYEVPQEMLDKAITYLQGSLDDVTNTDDSGRAYQCFALAMGGVYRTADMQALASRRDQLGNYARAVLAISLHKAGSPLASDMLTSLVGGATTSSGRAFFEGDTLRYGSWTSNTVETTAYAVWAMLELDPNNSLIGDSMAWLLSRRRRNGQYTTTKDTAAVVLAFARYVQITGELNPDMTVTAVVNGQQVDTVRFDTTSLGQKAHVVTIPGSSLRQGANTVRIERQGTGALYYTAVLEQHVRMNPIPALDNGISVSREYFLVTERLDQGQIVEDVTPLSGPVKIGDRVRVQLTMSVSHAADVEHVNLEDRFPSGFEVVEETQPRFGWFWRWSPWWSSREVHDDRVVFFATRVPYWHPTTSVRTYEYRYDMRAETAGDFLALPAFAEAVYAPETNGRTDAVLFRVDSN